MSAASPTTDTSADVETVEVYRCYPQPELVHLAVCVSGSTPPPPPASVSPSEPVAPRRRSPATSSPTPSTFAERLRDECDDDVANARHATAPAHPAHEDDDEQKENQQGNYKAAPLAPGATSTDQNGETAEEPAQQRTSQPAPPSSVDVRLRWGFEVADLRRVYEMHEDAFPLSYGPSYYEWLLDHDACMALVATVTPETFAQLTDTAEKANTDDIPLSWFPGYTPASPQEAAAGPRPVPPSASQRALTADVIAERAQVDSALAELEYIAQRKRETATRLADATHGDSGEGGSTYTEVVGFILGQCAYARHDAGHLFTNPTCYIGSFVVDPRWQRCGLGSELLQRFLTYVTLQRPLYARDYLHYDERKLIAMLAAAQLKRRSALHDETGSRAGKGSRDHEAPIAAAAAASSHGSTDTTGSAAAKSASFFTMLHQLVSAYVPEAVIWWEDRRARQRLRERGLTDAEVDAQRFRDRLAPDSLTDEEADEVRREAKHFKVQTGLREVWLHCLPGNMKATQLYARRGFTLHRVLKDYYDVDKERYDANLLLYACPVVGAVVPTNAAAAGDAACTDATTAAGSADMDAVVQQHDVQGEALSTATNASSTVGERTGMRRRHTHGRTEDGAAAASANPDASAAGLSLTAAHSDASSAAPAAATEVTEASRSRRSLAAASWLSPRTYAVVADVILCSAADGQEEWQRRMSGSGDVTGRRSWWETLQEVFLVMNAFGLLCAVLWLAYNVVLTGKVM